MTKMRKFLAVLPLFTILVDSVVGDRHKYLPIHHEHREIELKLPPTSESQVAASSGPSSRILPSSAPWSFGVVLAIVVLAAVVAYLLSH